MEEIWKDVKAIRGGKIFDFTGYYQVSNLGNVRSVDRIINYSDGRKYFYKGKNISKMKNKYGYIYIRLNKNRFYVHAKLHYLVAKAFIPNPENKPCIDHIDTNRANNNVNNLRWATWKENRNNPITALKNKNFSDEAICKMINTRIKRNRKTAPIRTIQYNDKGEIIHIYDKLSDVSKYGYDISHVSKCCRGLIKKAYKFKWKFDHEIYTTEENKTTRVKKHS